MAIYKGNQIIKRLYKGGTLVKGVFKGGQIVHPDMLADRPEEQGGWVVRASKFQIALRFGNLYSCPTFATPWLDPFSSEPLHGFTINKTGKYQARYHTELKTLSSGAYVDAGWAKVIFGPQGQILDFDTLTEGDEFLVQTSYTNVFVDNPNITHILNVGDVVIPYLTVGINMMERNAIAGLVYYG